METNNPAVSLISDQREVSRAVWEMGRAEARRVSLTSSLVSESICKPVRKLLSSMAMDALAFCAVVFSCPVAETGEDLFPDFHPTRDYVPAPLPDPLAPCYDVNNDLFNGFVCRA